MSVATSTKRETILNIQEKSLGEKYTFIRDSAEGFCPIGQGGSGRTQLYCRGRYSGIGRYGHQKLLLCLECPPYDDYAR